MTSDRLESLNVSVFVCLSVRLSDTAVLSVCSWVAGLLSLNVSVSVCPSVCLSVTVVLSVCSWVAGWSL